MREVRKGFWVSEERLLAFQQNRYGIEKTLGQQLKSLFTRKAKAEETSKPKNDST